MVIGEVQGRQLIGRPLSMLLTEDVAMGTFDSTSFVDQRSRAI
jgi:hypothetical protein